jgi:DNA replication protein DnaC
MSVGIGIDPGEFGTKEEDLGRPKLRAEFLFQVVAERAEKTAVILTTNLRFSESTQVIPNARLCKPLLDRITDRAHILETRTKSYRFRRTADKQERSKISLKPIELWK